MKKIVTIIAVLLLASTAASAQLFTKSIEEAHGYQVVYKAPLTYGEIRYCEDLGMFVLCGKTDNQFEHTMATIFLGEDKESAILSLEDLRKITSGEVKIPKEGVVVKGIDGKDTLIYKVLGETVFKTDGVAGSTHILTFMKNKEAKQAIEKFGEEDVEEPENTTTSLHPQLQKQKDENPPKPVKKSKFVDPIYR